MRPVPFSMLLSPPAPAGRSPANPRTGVAGRWGGLSEEGRGAKRRSPVGDGRRDVPVRFRTAPAGPPRRAPSPRGGRLRGGRIAPEGPSSGRAHPLEALRRGVQIREGADDRQDLPFEETPRRWRP